jgi:membrane-bound lytic murein transglycosylase D
MNFKSLLYIGLFLVLTGTNTFAQSVKSASRVSNDELEVDSMVSIPKDFDNTLDFMTNSWIIQRAKSSNCRSSDDAPVSDSICKLRLSKMPCLMEMPYNSTVRSFIDLYTVRKRRQVEYMLGMSEYYFPLFEQVLGANNLPLELKYLSIIESALNTTIVSRMGAAGLWQLMIGTGRMYGLEINSLVDERLSPVKASNAAAHFLRDLYSIYGDWHLVIAAYNCGPGNVNKAIRRAGGKRDYWAIYPYLPRETRGYVPIFIAANYSIHYATEHNLCAAVVNMPALTDTIMVHQRIHLEQVANVLNLPIEEIRLLNAQYRKDIIPGNIKPYSLCLPLNYANSFIDKFDQIVAYKADSLVNNRRAEIEVPQVAPVSFGGTERVSFHKVKPGETISEIAARYGIPASKLKKWNHIKGSRIQKGQRLKIIK